MTRLKADQAVEGRAAPDPGRRVVALLGNPNTGKTTLFNRLTGLRHKTSNFPGTTQEARIGAVGAAHADLIDMPGVYGLELDLPESATCRGVLAGEGPSPVDGRSRAPDAVCVVVDSTHLGRNLALVGEAMRRRLPMVVALTMVDLARSTGIEVDAKRLEEELGCPVVACNARTGEGVDRVAASLADARIPVSTPPGDQAGLARWAEMLARRVAAAPADAERLRRTEARTDRIDRVLTHPVLGAVVFIGVMAGLFGVIFSLAQWPMEAIDWLFGGLGGLAEKVLPEGPVRALVSQGVVGGVGATVIFLPQICLLFFLISLLEDTGYLARAALLMDRVLRPFGLPGHAFVPLLSSHACALPGIMSARGVPDPKERLATILVAPFMTCSARIPVYVLVTTLLFKDRPWMAALAFIGCYALGIAAGVLSALLARRTFLRGRSRPMAIELPTFKAPSLRTALVTTVDRALVFVKQAGTNILAICIILWWLGAYPHSEPPSAAAALREQAAALVAPEQETARAELEAEAEHLELSHAQSKSFAGIIGRSIQPLFEPLGFDWRLTIGVVTSFAAREVFVSTMTVVVAGIDDPEADGVVDALARATRDDGRTLLFTPAACWSLMVFYVLAMQCLPTLAVTAREAGGARWAFLQFAWMSAVAYLFAFIAYRAAVLMGGGA